MSRRPDVVVVGAGAAGAVLAARLTEDAGRHVLLLDAGPIPRGADGFGPALLDARLVPGAQPNHPATTAHPVRLTPERPWLVTRGRILGGSTTVNGGYFIRARREDFDRWAAAGNPAWAYDAVLPLLRTLENDLDFGPSELHGDQGPMRIRHQRIEHPAAVAFRDAARRLGFPAEPDKNDQAPPGFGPVPSNAVDGVRHNTGLAYLPPEILDRPNLTAIGGWRALRVVIKDGRATGVVVERDGLRTTVDAGSVVLSTGALSTPHLLQLSGIGPRADLERLGIPVIRDAPAVGACFSDHPQVVLDWTPHEDMGDPAESWLGGCLHLAHAEGGLDHAGIPGDLEVLQSLVPMAGLVSGAVSVPGAPLSFLASVQTPRPTGRLRIRAADPGTPPDIDYNFLSTAEDFCRLRQVVRVTAALIDTPPFADVSHGLLDPGPEVLDDDRALNHWIREHVGTAQHTCGTVPMGPADDPGGGAVDQFGRVHGVRALRVADTSILPDAPQRGPAATAVLIGEFIADAMRRGLG
ncbi:GMC family oxidoreductase N-terminal domain-containing protein [Streptomyces mexicanus]|uniref:GMC family oxidoreductase N-terminal domain-containing protein n=1 Tax=Streptomyces mexicanus TaxID=178566 RepID=A0A7X1LPU9_9ACTN|nr:GMC family oxidoreductase N-terminal domain-containing protein [Streptomyces mexicanus]